jgi:hypothetical protein
MVWWMPIELLKNQKIAVEEDYFSSKQFHLVTIMKDLGSPNWSVVAELPNGFLTR